MTEFQMGVSALAFSQLVLFNLITNNFYSNIYLVYWQEEQIANIVQCSKTFRRIITIIVYNCFVQYYSYV